MRAIGIGIVGCGSIARSAHLPAYARLGLRVLGCCDLDAEAAEAARRDFDIPRVFDRAAALIDDPDIDVIDIATFPDERPALIRQALAAGKHVLAQKPLTLDVGAARALVDEARERNVTLAVNLNGRWAPAWRIASDLVRDGAIGTVRAVTHVEDDNHDWLPGSRFDRLRHAVIGDFLIHWIDISHGWIGSDLPCSVRAHEYRTPAQPSDCANSLGATIDIAYENGASVVIRAAGCAAHRQGFPFWIHGTEGTISGRVRFEDFVQLERGGSVRRFEPLAEWFSEGFGATMCELLSAVVERREPSNSARAHLPALAVAAAACESAELDRPVRCGADTLPAR